MKYFFHTILVLLVTNVCFAQRQYTITNYTQENGLPSGTVRGIYKDTTGYIWFTAEGSVVRFDNYTYKTYHHNPDKPNGLPGNFVIKFLIQKKIPGQPPGFNN